ncbi:MAG: hypothetical protein AABX98_05785, partial [Nanoarchaeota archaeon]
MANYNHDLAQDYLEIMGVIGRVSRQHERYAAAIAHADVNVRDYYGKFGGLGKLHVRGIGREARTALDLII